MNKPLTAADHSQLWDNFRSGDRHAFFQLYDRFAADLYRYGYNLIRNKQLVEDCLHELFLHLHEKKAQLGPTDNIRFYLYRALRRRLLDMVGKLNKFDSEDYIFDSAAFLIQPYERVLIDEQVVEHQKLVIVAELNKLPKRQKEIIYLVYMKGLSYPQAAEVMGISMKSVYNTINIALTTLRVYVRQSYEKRGVLWGMLGMLYFTY